MKSWSNYLIAPSKDMIYIIIFFSNIRFAKQKILKTQGLSLNHSKDYICPEVWLEYIQYAIRWLSQENGISRFRSLCEKAIQAVGLHPEKGNSIWEVYRETELMIEDESQKEKVISIFRRQCRLPLYELEGTYKEFKAGF